LLGLGHQLSWCPQQIRSAVSVGWPWSLGAEKQAFCAALGVGFAFKDYFVFAFCFLPFDEGRDLSV